MSEFKKYIEELNKEYQSGNASEHTYRYCLKNLLEAQFPYISVTNEPKRIIKCGSPDYLIEHNQIPIGYIEAKDVPINLDDSNHTEQLSRYMSSLDNLIFTNYLEFRFFREEKILKTVVIGEIHNGQIKPKSKNFNDLNELLCSFVGYKGRTITTAADLAERMAAKAIMLNEVIAKSLTQKTKTPLNTLFEFFKKHLIKDIKPQGFADMYAQTIAYGMFAARLQDDSLDTFSRSEAVKLIPSGNPFLQKLFQHIAGDDIDERISWIVDDLADVFRATDVGKLMKGYGKSTQQNDPFLHFYETFLDEYDGILKKKRGVFYTPEPIVSFIVRAVDEILKEEFELEKGLANTEKTIIEVEESDNNKVSKIEKEFHKVQIFDPATGTGTFLAHITRYIHDNYFKSQQGIWSNYVKEDLIPRLNGFELLMASYAMAHIKLEMVLRESECELDEERLNIFLTNSLEQGQSDIDDLPSLEWFTTEVNEANLIKRKTPVMVVLGNPPYKAISSNKGKWITGLIEDYKYVDGQHFKEQKHWLGDDYVKFIRYGQHCIDRNGEGVLAYINNNSFLDNPTFRAMRWHLLRSFDKIYILDLHGSAKKNESDENVFNITQGVSINIFIKTGKKREDELAQVFHYDLYGKRESKYEFLRSKNLNEIKFTEFQTLAPYYFFDPKKCLGKEQKKQYEEGFLITDLFPHNRCGIITAANGFVIANSKDEIESRVTDFLQNSYTEEEFKEKYSLGKNYPEWVINNKHNIGFNKDQIIKIGYRPFDTHWTAFNENLIWRWGYETMRHFIAGENVGLVLCRQFKAFDHYQHVFITKDIFESSLVSNKTSATCYGFPLYLYHKPEQETFIGSGRTPNLNNEIVDEIANDLGLQFTSEKENTDNTFAPIDLLDYIYAVLHSPSYRVEYKECLKVNFPRVPYPTDKSQFWNLVELGGELRELHLLESKKLDKLTTTYLEEGNNKVEKISYEVTDEKTGIGKVKINQTQYFGNVPKSVWDFYVGCYKPAQQWLKDRKKKRKGNPQFTPPQFLMMILIITRKLLRLSRRQKS